MFDVKELKHHYENLDAADPFLLEVIVPKSLEELLEYQQKFEQDYEKIHRSKNYDIRMLFEDNRKTIASLVAIRQHQKNVKKSLDNNGEDDTLGHVIS